MKRLINFSGGDCSFLAAEREVKEFGVANCKLIFADTLIEHPDLYDFNRRAEDALGIQLTRICVGLTPWQLFKKEGLIGNDRFPICSTKLKREPLNEWMEANYEMDCNQSNAFYERGVVVLGFDFSEFNRVADFQNAHPTWEVSAPMTVAPLWDKCRIISECRKRGFSEKTLYRIGFPHNNCGGACVKAGISHFVHLLKVMPHVFLEWERQELDCREDFKARGISSWDFSILKDRRGGETKPLTLHTLRLRVEAGEEFDKNDWGGCGCGGAVIEQP